MGAEVFFDDNREERTGLPEAVFCAGKDEGTVLSLLEAFSRRPVLFTRLEPRVFRRAPEETRVLYDYDALSRTAFSCALPARPESLGRVAVVSAGTSDAFVSHEASRTLDYLGIPNSLFEDCGVAGLWRIEKRLSEIRECDVAIVCAGLDAALPTVLAGLVKLPILGVPTSVGYGAADGGWTALRAMLCSCSPGVSVLNIDNGYGAACAAARILGVLTNGNRESI